jgi:integrase
VASIRKRIRKDGGVTYAVLFGLDDRQSSLSFEDEKSAEAFQGVVNAMGARRALELYKISPEPTRSAAEGHTVTSWLDHYIEHLTGLDQGTVEKYQAYVRNDITPVIGPIQLTALGREDVAKWVQWLAEFGAADRSGNRRPASPKTIANKHGFLSAALAAAVPKHIPANPAAATTLPQGDAKEVDDEMVLLSAEQIQKLIGEVTEYWRPLVRFLVASGCRWGEATALRPGDVNRKEGTVRIRRAWTYSQGGHRLVKPKGKSLRTINVPASVLDKLDYSHEWLFVNRRGDPVRAASFHGKVWKPALTRCKLEPPPRIHDLRHTCASWLIAKGVPLPVIQGHLGHQSILTTVSVYGHIDRLSFRAAADVIGKILEGDSSDASGADPSPEGEPATG